MDNYFHYELKVYGRPNDEQAELELKIDTDYGTAKWLLDRFRELVSEAAEE